MRILALDWGTKRVGVAISDESGKIAFPLNDAIETKSSLEKIESLAKEKEVGLILLGFPKTLKGDNSRLAWKVGDFKTELEKITGLAVELLDERFSTVQAEKLLQEQGVKQVDQTGIKDNIAAQVMLQQYLDTNAPR